MTILTQSTILQLNSPATGSHPHPTQASTLTELRAARAAWLKEAIELGLIEDARKIARWLGSRASVEKRPMWTVYVWQDGDLRITLYEGSGCWMPGNKAYSRIQTLVITVRGEYDVANIRQEDDSFAPESFWRPGDWIGPLWRFKPDAESAARRAGQAAMEAERQVLLSQLLIGVEV